MLVMMGIPPATEASNAIERPNSRARSNSSGPCSASRALLAVTISLPLSNSCNRMLRAGSSPPTSWATTVISGSSVIVFRSSAQHTLRQIGIPWLVDVVYDDAFQPQRPTSMPGCAITVVQQQACYSRAHGSHTDNPDIRAFHFCSRIWLIAESSLLRLASNEARPSFRSGGLRTRPLAR